MGSIDKIKRKSMFCGNCIEKATAKQGESSNSGWLAESIEIQPKTTDSGAQQVCNRCKKHYINLSSVTNDDIFFEIVLDTTKRIY